MHGDPKVQRQLLFVPQGLRFLLHLRLLNGYANEIVKVIHVSDIRPGAAESAVEFLACSTDWMIRNSKNLWYGTRMPPFVSHNKGNNTYSTTRINTKNSFSHSSSVLVCLRGLRMSFLKTSFEDLAMDEQRSHL